jgi:hypothetical protein
MSQFDHSGHLASAVRGDLAFSEHLGAELFESSFAEDSASKKDDDEKVIKK